MPLTGHLSHVGASFMHGGKTMASIEDRGGPRWSPWRIAGWSVAALLLLLPAAAMQFTSEVVWDETDFIAMGILVGSVGLGIEFLVRRSSSLAYRLGAVIALLTVFLTIWVNLAVGMIGSEDNPHNLLFGGVIAVALIGAPLVRFEAAGMARVLILAAVAQAAAGASGLPADPRGGIFSLIFAGPWLLAAALFWSSARSQTAAGTGR
jgi:hypothetical protein